MPYCTLKWTVEGNINHYESRAGDGVDAHACACAFSLFSSSWLLLPLLTHHQNHHGDAFAFYPSCVSCVSLLYQVHCNRWRARSGVQSSQYNIIVEPLIYLYCVYEQCQQLVSQQHSRLEYQDLTFVDSNTVAVRREETVLKSREKTLLTHAHISTVVRYCMEANCCGRILVLRRYWDCRCWDWQ